jgi:hypothetical protein
MKSDGVKTRSSKVGIVTMPIGPIYVELRLGGIPALLVLYAGIAVGQDAFHDVDKAITKTGHAVKHATKKVGKATKMGAKGVGHGTKIAAKDAGKAVKTGSEKRPATALRIRLPSSRKDRLLATRREQHCPPGFVMWIQGKDRWMRKLANLTF